MPPKKRSTSKETVAEPIERHAVATGRVRFRLGPDESYQWIDVEVKGNGIQIRGGDGLAIFPSVSNLLHITLDRI